MTQPISLTRERIMHRNTLTLRRYRGYIYTQYNSDTLYNLRISGRTFRGCEAHIKRVIDQAQKMRFISSL